MQLILQKVRQNSLFFKLFSLTFIIVISVSFAISLTSLRMSERLFVDTFCITNAKVIEQIKENFESFNYSVVLAANSLHQNIIVKDALSGEYSNSEMMNVYYLLHSSMEQIKTYLDTYDASIMITGMNSVSFSTDRTFWPFTDEEWMEHEVYQKTLDKQGQLMYQHIQIENRNQDLEQMIIASKALTDRTSGVHYGSVYFSIKESDFRKFYSNVTSPGNDIFLINQKGDLISTNRSELIGSNSPELLTLIEEMTESQENYMESDFMGKKQIILTEYLPFFDMYIINTIDREMLNHAIIDKKSIALVSVGIVVIALIIIFFLSKRMTNSLSSLVKHIGKTSKTGFIQYAPIDGTYETRQIGNAFNSMLDELHRYVDEQVISQKKIRQAELAALQQQINPHFLYNTLTSIKFLIQQGSKEEAIDTIHSLISLLQNTLGNVSETVSIEQEIENLKNYVLINQKRYGNRISVNYFVEQDSDSYLIPKLILQPFVENAFFHGFNQKQNGSITIMIWKENELLLCEIIDNGDGMDIAPSDALPSKKKKKHQFSGIGIRNVHERLQMLYGETYGVEMTSSLGEWTKVRICLPANKEQ
ncbi:sensor histidine kinase [Alkalihalobacillus trypoxylicola]|uniref:HAMP domain-containing protein n=1 Tax=Alkalihalobacillus trypoxylicola TaxID=519424 RepID=A0A162D1B1_9BACI|nr:histidine kinase [Alkalihalobacillus trypoxylicola]KYG27691.1 hypothetical protein AZF04_10910 [Alkalihalobacillus trypoxylicola]